MRTLVSIWSIALALAAPSPAAQIVLSSSRTDIGPKVFFFSQTLPPPSSPDSVTLGAGTSPLTQTVTLTPGLAFTGILYNALLFPGCMGCQGLSGSATVHGALAATLDNSMTSADFSQTFQDVIVNAGATHLFTAAAGTLITLAFGDGSALTVQPLALAPTSLQTDVLHLTTVPISATFLLSAPTPIPEPGSAVLLLVGAAALVLKRSRGR